MVRTNTAALIQRAQRGAEAAADRVYAPSLFLVTEGLIALGIAALVASVAPTVTLVAVLTTLALLILPAGLTSRTFRRWGTEEQAAEKLLLQELQQTLGGLKEVKVASREPFFLARFRTRLRDLADARRKRTVLSEALRLSVETTFVLVLLIVVALVTWRTGSGRDLVALLGLYAYAGFRLVPSANRITLHLGSIRSGLAFARDLRADLANAPATTPRPQPATGDRTASREIVFDGVSFEYQPGTRALEDVRLTVHAGEWIGIVGPTGAGKSTLIDVLLGLFEPTTGAVRVDGRDIREDLAGWRRQVGYVPQSFYLLDDTVRQNVAFGIRREEVNDEWVRRALDAAQLTDVVAELPDGLDTIIGERGARLSGGQRQRIAIARALYHDPSVLVFDEATAALDSQTELDLTRAIEGLHGAKTAFVIAHRLATVRRCDRLVVLDRGRVVAEGSFDELMRRDERFRELVRAGDAGPPITT